MQTGDAALMPLKNYQETSSTELYDEEDRVAAHQTLPYGSRVKVSNLSNRKTVIVRIIHKPNLKNSVSIYLSKKMMEQLGIPENEKAQVRIEKILNDLQSSQHDPNTPEYSEKEITKKELFKISSQKSPEKGFGIQVGLFKHSANLIKYTAEIEEKHHLPMFIHIVHFKDEKAYRVILGKFDTERAAKEFLLNLGAEFPDAHVISL